MKAAIFATVVIVLGGFGIGAFLVMNGHPWFGLLVIILASSVQSSYSSKREADDE